MAALVVEKLLRRFSWNLRARLKKTALCLIPRFLECLPHLFVFLNPKHTKKRINSAIRVLALSGSTPTLASGLSGFHLLFKQGPSTSTASSISTIPQLDPSSTRHPRLPLTRDTRMSSIKGNTSKTGIGQDLDTGPDQRIGEKHHVR